MQITIRGAGGPDIPYLYEICLKTGDAGKDGTRLFSDPYILGQYYAAPYLFYDPGLCFIAEEENLPQGYMLGVGDTTAFNQWMETQWLPGVRRRYPGDDPAKIRSPEEGNLITRIHTPLAPSDAPWVQEFPAHLHIDLLPAIQGKGWGKALMQTFLTALQRRSCPGVHLGVARANTGGLAFYRSLGFSVLAEGDGGFTLGRTLS